MSQWLRVLPAQPWRLEFAFQLPGFHLPGDKENHWGLVVDSTSKNNGLYILGKTLSQSTKVESDREGHLTLWPACAHKAHIHQNIYIKDNSGG